MTTPAIVASFMNEQLRRTGILYQEEIVDSIHSKFGSDFTIENDRGNLGIHPSVLKEFRILTPDAVWEKRERCWRLREGFDSPGRRQDA